MEPSNVTHWSGATFTIQAKITFSIYKERVSEVAAYEMLAAVVLADRESPWWDRGGAARLGISEPRQTLEDHQVVVYDVDFQSTCTLEPSQLPAYVKYTSQLAENAHKFIRNADAVCWIGSTVNFSGTTIIFKDGPSVRL